MGSRGNRFFVCTVLAILPAALFLTTLAGPAVARADSRPGALPDRSCPCSTDASRDDSSRHEAIPSQRGSIFVRLSPSGKGGPLSFRAGKRVINIFALDIDHDGDADLIAVRRDRRVHVWWNNGHGQFVRRDGPGLKVSQGSRLMTGHAHQADALCSPSSSDGAGSADCERTSFIIPEPAETDGLASGAEPATDIFFASIHPRGPPAQLA